MTFSAVKTAQENYLKIMQGLIARSVFLHGTYSRHNTIIVHLYETLKRQRFLEQLLLTSSTTQVRKELVDDTDNGGDSDVDDDSKSSDDSDDNNKSSDDDSDDAVMDKNSRLLSTASHINDMITKSSDGHGLVSFLIIHVVNRQRDVLLYVGQQLITPMGNGVITQLRPHDCMVTCQLPFGLLYAHISRVVGWCRVICDDYIDMAGFTLDTASVEWLCRYCEANLIHSYTLSKQDHASIQQLIAANACDETVVVNHHHHHPLPPHTTTTSTAFAGGGGVIKADGEDDVFNHQDEMMVDELSEETDLEAETNSNDTKAPPSQVDGPVASSSSADHCDPISSDTSKAMITNDDSNRSLVSEQQQQHHQSVVFPLPIVAVTGEIPSRQRVLSIMERQVHDNYRYYHAYHCTSYSDDNDNYEYGEDDEDDDDEYDDVYDDDQYTVHLTAKSC